MYVAIIAEGFSSEFGSYCCFFCTYVHMNVRILTFCHSQWKGIIMIALIDGTVYIDLRLQYIYGIYIRNCAI